MQTRYTAYCNFAQHLTQGVRKLIQDLVIPAAEARCKDNPDAKPAHYRVIQYPFLRIIRWLMTFERINTTNDMQAIGAGARGIGMRGLCDGEALRRVKKSQSRDAI